MLSLREFFDVEKKQIAGWRRKSLEIKIVPELSPEDGSDLGADMRKLARAFFSKNPNTVMDGLEEFERILLARMRRENTEERWQNLQPGFHGDMHEAACVLRQGYRIAKDHLADVFADRPREIKGCKLGD